MNIEGMDKAMKAFAGSECSDCTVMRGVLPARIERRNGAVYIYHPHPGGEEHLSIFNEAQFDSLRMELK